MSIERRKELSYDEVVKYTVMQNLSDRLNYRKAHGEQDKTLEKFTDKKEAFFIQRDKKISWRRDRIKLFLLLN